MKIELFGLCALALSMLGAAPAATNAAPVATQAPKADEITLGDATGDTAVKLAVKNASKPGDEKALVDIDCEDATLAEVLRQFRHSVGANIICGESSNLQQRVSLSLHQVPWFESLQSILNTRNFRLEPRNGIYFVSEESKQEPLYTRTYTLNHASAEDLAKMFNTNYGEKDKNGKLIKPVASFFAGANALVVTANEQTLSECEAILKAVDKAIAQIYIEARFIEASTEAMHKLGVQWNQLESWGATAKNIEMGWERNTGRLNRYSTGTQTEYVDRSNPDGSTSTEARKTKTYLTPSAITAAPGAGRQVDSMDWGHARGFSGQLSADDFRLALSAFESMTDVKIFSNPKIIVSNGKEAMVDMTTKFPNVRVQATRNTSNGSDSLDISTQLEVIPGEDKLMFAKEAFYSWGITLSVKPRISPDGLINVEIIPTISQLDVDCPNTVGGFYSIKGGDSSAYSAFPVIGVKRLTTDFTMKDGSTAVIGGLSKTEEQDIDSGIPYLRKIPWVGQKIFGWKSREKVQKEVIVFVTVGIADPGSLPKDAGLPKNAIMGREYVNGAKLEPGDREKPSLDILMLDKRNLDDPARK